MDTGLSTALLSSSAALTCGDALYTRVTNESESRLSQHNDIVLLDQCHDIIVRISPRRCRRSRSYNLGPKLRHMGEIYGQFDE